MGLGSFGKTGFGRLGWWPRMTESGEKSTPIFSIQDGQKRIGCLDSVFMEIRAVTGIRRGVGKLFWPQIDADKPFVFCDPARLGPLVMIAAGEDANLLGRDLVNNPMFLIDSSRPAAPKFVFQRLRLADAGKRAR